MPKQIIISGILFILTSHIIGSASRPFNNFHVPPLKHSIDYSKLEAEGIDNEVLDCALTGYAKLNEQSILAKDSIITIIDYSIECNKDRLFVIDLNSGQILFRSMVAHGKNSGEYFATSFSNKIRSHKSSLGFFITEKTYYGRHGYSLRLKGLEEDYNTNAMKRAVVIHGAHYVSKDYIARNGRIGRSFGCPALPEDRNDEIIDCIKEGSCFFVYYPDSYYLNNSTILN